MYTRRLTLCGEGHTARGCPVETLQLSEWGAVESVSVRPKAPVTATRAPDRATDRHRSTRRNSVTTRMTIVAAVFIGGVFNASRADFRHVSAGTFQCWPMGPSFRQTRLWVAEWGLFSHSFMDNVKTFNRVFTGYLLFTSFD